MMSDRVSDLLDAIERVKAEMKLKDVLISEMYIQHIQERQEVKKELFVQRRIMEQKHEEEKVRIESDILKIKAEMDNMEKQLTGLMTKLDSGSSKKSVRNLINKVSSLDWNLNMEKMTRTLRLNSVFHVPDVRFVMK